MKPVRRFSIGISKFNRLMGAGFCVCAPALALAMFAAVAMRYGLGKSPAWLNESTHFLHAFLFLGVAAYAVQRDKHVRVDVLYQYLSRKKRALVDTLGFFLLLAPLLCGVIIFSYGFIRDSWRLLEGSAEYQGMPGIFLLKSAILLYAVTMLAEGAAVTVRRVGYMRRFSATEKSRAA